VGSGFDEADLAELSAALASLSRSTQPFGPSPEGRAPRTLARTARWVEPVLVVEVAFAEWTPDGRLRQPVYLGRRDDTDPESVVRE
jgi:bifunctional non-homologous end joining protein LigD